MEDRADITEDLEIIRYDPALRDFTDWNDCRVQAQIRRFKDGELYDVSRWGYETLSIGLLTNAGGLLMWKALRGDAITPFNNTNSYIGVGTATTAAAYTDTGLTGEIRKAMDTGYPLVTGEASGPAGNRSILFRSTFAASDANQAWNEFGVFNASTAGTLLDRFVSAQGTKANTEVWELSLTLQVG